MDNILTISTVILGLVATFYPARSAVKYFKDSKGIGRVIAWMLIGESISMAVATYFAINTALDSYPDMGLLEMSALRWVIFATGLITSIKLVRYIEKRFTEMYSTRQDQERS